MEILGYLVIFAVVVALIYNIWRYIADKGLEKLRTEEIAAKVRAAQALGSNGTGSISHVPGGFLPDWENTPLVKEIEIPAVVQKCNNCEHFDLEEGQAVIANNPAFAMAANVLAPNAMGLDCDEKGIPIDRNDIPNKCKWRDFGACYSGDGDTLVWGGDSSCVKWEEKI